MPRLDCPSVSAETLKPETPKNPQTLKPQSSPEPSLEASAAGVWHGPAESTKSWPWRSDSQSPG